MKQDLVIFDKMFTRMLNSKRGNLTEQDVEAFKYTFSRIGEFPSNVRIFLYDAQYALITIFV